MIPKPHRIENEKYLEYIRNKTCLISGDAAEAHHLVSRGAGGSDYTSIPFAHVFHVEIEQIGVKKFEEKYNINVWKEAHRLLERYMLQR